MSKTKQKRLATYLLLLSLCSAPVSAATQPQSPETPNSVGAYIYVDGNSDKTEFNVGTVSGWTGQNQGAVVNYYSDKNVILNSQGGMQSYIGNIAGTDTAGAIYNGTLDQGVSITVNGNALFQDNQANRGGAIYNEGTMNFVNGEVTFKGNNSTSDALGQWSGGGAIVNLDGIMNFNGGKVIFKNNHAEGNGGAILSGNTGLHDTTSINFGNSVSFTGNTATGDGGAIYNGKGSEITISGGSSFTNNEAGGKGGAIYNAGELTLDSTKGEIIFSGNTVGPEGNKKDNDIFLESDSSMELKGDNLISFGGGIVGDDTTSIISTATNVVIKGDNSNFTGTYEQTQGNVSVESGAVFFGIGDNKVTNGKMLFKQGASLAKNSSVELAGNYDATAGDLMSPVLDLDGRINAKFDGSNKLVLDGEQQSDEGFVFTNGILENAILHGNQNFVGKGSEDKQAVITMRDGSGFATDTEAKVSGLGGFIFGTGSVADGGTVEIASDGFVGLVAQNLDWHTIASGDGSIVVVKDDRESYSPNINIYGNQSNFKGEYYQDAGRVTVTEGSTFFGGNSTVTGDIDKGTSGDLYLEKGSFISGDILVTNSKPDGGATDPHGRIFIEDKIFDVNGNELTDISELMKGNLYYNAKNDEDGDGLGNIKIQNGGLILSNGTVFDGSKGTTVFQKDQNGGVVDIGFSNGSGVNGDIELREDTMLSYGDNAFIKDDSTLIMSDSAVLNFINDTETINYNPVIVGGGAIYKEGLATVNVSSAIDMKGEVKVSEGTLNFTNTDKVIFRKDSSDPYGRQTGNLKVGTNSSSANLNINASQIEFGGDVISTAQDETQSSVLFRGNTKIDGILDANNTKLSLLGNTSIFNTNGKDDALKIAGDSALNLMGGSVNQVTVNGDMTISDVKDGKLPVSFDYDGRTGTMDSILVNGDFNSSGPLLVSGINFITSPRDANFSLDANNLIQVSGSGEPRFDATNFYSNAAMGRYFLSNGDGGSVINASLEYLNPQQYRGQVATIASWQNQLVVNNMLFDHMGVVTRQLMEQEKTANKYAAAYPQFAPYQYDMKGGNLWYKAYGNFERLSMTRGLSVGNNAYGSLIGADFPLINLKHGWKLVPTAYIGYNGAHQTFNGTSMYQNGAQLGVMGTAYKGDFITSLLAYGGGYANDMSMRGEFGSGSDTTGNWFAGVASKSAYNFHLPWDLIFQPTALVSYNAFGSQNWGSNFGVMSMSSGMLNGINVAPGFNLIWQKKTFSIYATAQMVYNIMGGVDGQAGNIDLGYVRMRHSYFEYGLGVSKMFKDRFSGFLQFTIRNGGRTGIGFSGGLQFKL